MMNPSIHAPAGDHKNILQTWIMITDSWNFKNLIYRAAGPRTRFQKFSFFEIFGRLES